MTFGTGFAIYFLFWWLCLFIILPFGARSQIEAGEVEPGTEPGAPFKLKIWRRLAANTLFAGLLFALYVYVTQVLGYSIDNIPSPFPQDNLQ